MRSLGSPAKIAEATLTRSGVSTTVSGLKRSGRIGELATPGGISTTIPIELVGAGIQTDEWSTTLHGGTHCQHPSIAKSKEVGSEHLLFAFVKLCRRELCALRQCLAQSIFIV